MSQFNTLFAIAISKDKMCSDTARCSVELVKEGASSATMLYIPLNIQEYDSLVQFREEAVDAIDACIEEFKKMTQDDAPTVTVCDRCLMASCWQGKFMCEDSDIAGTVEKTVTELDRLGLEHPCYYSTE